MSELSKHRTARRIQALRGERSITQEVLSKAVGFADRQTLAAIEAGERSISPDELVAVAAALETTVADLLDPYRLGTNEAAFSFRSTTALDADVVREFEAQAGRWIATYRETNARLGVRSHCLGAKLELSDGASYEEVEAAAEALVEEWNLGERPAEHLERAIERKLHALVLYVDMPEGLSGAASYMPGLSTILINRRESRSRRFFDLAHELFHVLTWDAMPPRPLEVAHAKGAKGRRAEQLANKFAAALLMPARIIKQHWDVAVTSDIAARIVQLAAKLWVSPEALRFRLYNLGLLAKRMLKSALPASAIITDDRPALFSKRYIAPVRNAVDHGFLSARRAAALLGMSLHGFALLCEQHGCPLAHDA
ncbi:MAG: XRE family transcriptional regulator [Gemmatimonadota bacterium]|nr:XRE family transcriptional regulator [Gemmatimonadota bacterium]